MEISVEVIGAIGTAIIAPIVAVLKVNSDTNKRKNNRDTQLALIEKEITDLKKKTDGIDELKEAIHKIEIALSNIQQLIEIFVKEKCK